MLDIKLIRENKAQVEQSLLKRLNKEDFNLDTIINLDDNRRHLLLQVEKLLAQRNKASKTKPDAKTIKEMKALGEEIKNLEEQLKKVEADLLTKLSALPNILADDVPAGGKENNQIIKTFKKPPHFDFEPKNHVELATSLGLIDYQRATRCPVAVSGLIPAMALF